MKFVFFLLSAAILGGCSSTGLSIAPDYELRDTKGVVFLSVRHQPISACDKPAPFFAYIHKPGNSAALGRPLNIKNLFIEPDFRNPDGYFYVLELDPEDYYLSHNELSFKDHGVEKRIRYQFNVKPGKATYLGELTFTREHRDPAKKDCGVVRVKQGNRYNRDLGLLIEQVITITPDDVEQHPAKVLYAE